MTSENIKNQIIHKLAEELTVEKTVTDSQLLGISRHYSVASFEDLKGFVDQKLSEKGALDLFMMLSYNFTPDLENRAIYSPFLDCAALTSGEVEEIIQDLTRQQLKATLGAKGHSAKVTVPIQEDVIRRYVRNLRLDSGLSDRLRKVIGELIPEKDHAIVKAIFRDEVWQKAPWNEDSVVILYAFSRKKFRAEKLNYLTTFLASNHPRDMKSLIRLIQEVIESYETEVRRIEKGAKTFFNETIRESYDGSEADKRGQEEKRLEDQKRQLADVTEIAEDLAS
ncbi:MAG: hypothetical protein HZC17_04650 [Candidatus Omnitrophica bacterium]|nr:hypothetical protein [Candidatus Omnitrophota bacterium]